MGTIKEFAQSYEGTARTRNITELPKVSTKLEIFEKELTNKEGKPFTLHYVVIDEDEFRIPVSVISSLKTILEDNPNLEFFKVKSTGTGMNTEYTVIPLS